MTAKRYFTVADIVDCPLSRALPFGITNVSQSQMSIARHYGGCTWQGEKYTYMPPTDELIRDDVLHWLVAKRKAGKVKPAQTESML